MFYLTYLGLLDKTFGVSAGTSAAGISTIVTVRFVGLFSRRHEHSVPT